MHFHRPQRSRSQVPIVPMIDILFILLVFVIATTRFNDPRDVLRIELPTVREVPTDVLTDTRSILAIDATGAITLDAVLVPDGLLANYLAAFRNANPGRKLELKPDGNVSLDHLLGVWDAMIRSGMEIGEVPARIQRRE
jgi:biopolymer transport protein ExbD